MKDVGVKKTTPNPLTEVFHSTGSGLLWLVILLTLGGLYLSVSARTAQLGRQVINLTEEVRQQEFIRNEKAALLAEMTSPQRMKAILDSEGYREATPNDIVYAHLEGATLGKEFVAPPPDRYFQNHNPLLSPAYTETLIDGFRRWLGVGEIE